MFWFLCLYPNKYFDKSVNRITHPIMVYETIFFLLPLLLFISLHSNHASAINSISLDHSLSGDQTITSNNGKFVMGFFRLNEGNPPLFYIGIWYKNDSRRHPVWIANRETPFAETTSSKLKIADDGNLVLIDQSAAQIWSTNLTHISSKSTVAVIQDSGNLVLRDGSDPMTVLWDSCDHPTDTWLPGCYLGSNKVTGENRRLTSWKNSSNPAPGFFSLELESDEAFIKWNSSNPVWSSRDWIFELSVLYFYPEYDSPIVIFKHVSSAEVNYFTYSMKDNGSIVVFVMNYSGKIMKVLLGGDQWQFDEYPDSPSQCGPYPFCGPFGSCSMLEGTHYCHCPLGFHSTSHEDQSKGCVRDEPLQCGTDDVFSERGVTIPVSYGGYSIPVDSASSCELACRNNCSCTAYSYDEIDRSCSVWYGDLLSLHADYGSLYLRLGPTNLKASTESDKGVSWIIVGAVSSFATCIAVILLIIRRHRRRDTVHKMKMARGAVVPFRYSELKQITKDFSEKLGGGGFGSVFKGTLPDSSVVAIKKLEGILQGEKQFRSEVSTIGVIHHVNLVRLYGFCAEGPNKLLVYEYMPNGSLDFRLFRNTSEVLDWKTRYQIALDTARGLSYLHEKCRDCIIHCDIKPDNVLLDASFGAKIADFGLAKIVGREFSTVLTTMRGTIGYLAPEWISGGSITSKADVYSYGMMLLEIISGRRNTKLIDNVHFFPLLAANKVLEGDVLSLLDPRLDGDANLEELDRACKVACWCIQDNEDCRLSMGQVIQILEGITEVSIPPISRLLQVLAENIESLN